MFNIFRVRFLTTSGVLLGEQFYVERQLKFLNEYAEIYYCMFKCKLKDGWLNVQIEPINPQDFIAEINKTPTKVIRSQCV